MLYRIHTILTDNPVLSEVEGGIQFAEQPRSRNTAWSRQMRFGMICEANDIEHRLTKSNHSWNRTITGATIKRFHYDSYEQLRVHLADFMAAYNLMSAEGAQWPHALRIHCQNLDVRAGQVHR